MKKLKYLIAMASVATAFMSTSYADIIKERKILITIECFGSKSMCYTTSNGDAVEKDDRSTAVVHIYVFDE